MGKMPRLRFQNLNLQIMTSSFNQTSQFLTLIFFDTVEEFLSASFSITPIISEIHSLFSVSTPKVENKKPYLPRDWNIRLFCKNPTIVHYFEI